MDGIIDRRHAAEVADEYVLRATRRIQEVGIPLKNQNIVAVALIDACQDLLALGNAERLTTRPGETRQDAAGEPQGQGGTDPSEHPLSGQGGGSSSLDWDPASLPESELPGARSHSDFTGETESYVHCPNCNAQARLYPDPNTRLRCNNCGYTEDGHG